MSRCSGNLSWHPKVLFTRSNILEPTTTCRQMRTGAWGLTVSRGDSCTGAVPLQDPQAPAMQHQALREELASYPSPHGHLGVHGHRDLQKEAGWS